MGNNWNEFEKGENGEKIDYNGGIFAGDQTMVKGSSGIQKIDFVKKKNKYLRDPAVEREKKYLFELNYYRPGAVHTGKTTLYICDKL